jgi:hypothetical protein
MKRHESAFVEANARESLNFQLTIIIGWVISGILSVVGIGLILFGVLLVLNVVLVIVATVKTSENKIYRYPFSLRLVK